MHARARNNNSLLAGKSLIVHNIIPVLRRAVVASKSLLPVLRMSAENCKLRSVTELTVFSFARCGMHWRLRHVPPRQLNLHVGTSSREHELIDSVRRLMLIQ